MKVNLKEIGQNDRHVQNDITIYVEYLTCKIFVTSDVDKQINTYIKL